MKRIVIVGSGESGFGAAVLAKAKGYDVFVTDKNTISAKYKDALKKYKINFEENTHSFDKILNADEIVKSPGIPNKVELIKKAKELSIPVISEIEFAGRFTNAYMIGITGSNGKTTTAKLTYHVLKNAGLNVGLAGNVGQSFAYQVATCDFDYYVLEISSFQLDDMFEFKCNIAVIMNITPDHLDRYDYDFNKYADSKFRITQNQKQDDVFIYSADNQTITEKISKTEINSKQIPFSFYKELGENSVYHKNEKIFFNNQNKFNMSVQDLSLPGIHNSYNSMAAGAIAQVLKIKKESIRSSLMDFKNVEHRLEPVIKVHGIEFINDSKATNINSVWYALESMTTKIVWIVGGVDKGNEYGEIMELVKKKVKAIVCLGVDNSKLHEAFDGVIEDIVDAKDMESAVNAAYYLANEGDTVLLSPACASFDLFDNYEDRGIQFKKAVRGL